MARATVASLECRVLAQSAAIESLHNQVKKLFARADELGVKLDLAIELRKDMATRVETLEAKPVSTWKQRAEAARAEAIRTGKAVLVH